MYSEGGAELKFFRSKNPLLFWIGIMAVILAVLLLLVSMFFQINETLALILSIILVVSMTFLWFSAFLKDLKKIKNKKP